MTTNDSQQSSGDSLSGPSQSFSFHTRRLLLKCFIASIALCGAIGIYCLVRGNIGRFEEKILATTALVGATTILAMCGMASIEYRRWKIVGFCEALGPIPTDKTCPSCVRTGWLRECA